MSILLELLSKNESIIQIATHLSRGERVVASGVFSPFRAVLSVLLRDISRCPVLVVTPGADGALEVYQDVLGLTGPGGGCFRFMQGDVLAEQVLARSPEEISETVSALDSLAKADGTPPVIVCSAASAPRSLPSSAALKALSIEVHTGAGADPQRLAVRLVEAGYERVDAVERVGQFSVRGGIVDVYPPDADRPIRIEVDLDRVESIRRFDPDTQRSVEYVDQVMILPSPTALEAGGTSTIFDWLGSSGIVLVDEPHRVLEEADKLGNHTLADEIKKRERILYLFALPHALPKPLETPLGAALDLGIRPAATFMGRWADFVQEVGRKKREGWRVIYLAHDEERAKRMRTALEGESLPVDVETGVLSSGFEMAAGKLCVLTEKDVLGREKRVGAPTRKTRRPGDLILNDLKPGDYVVHVNHGIGQYLGMRTLEIENTHRDYLFIRYAGGDALYVPSDQVDLLEKYVGGEGAEPRLNRLGGAEWNRQKRRVKESVKQMARELLELYTARRSIRGYAFSPDTPWQKEFEEAFRFEETPDQREATDEIKRDMEAPRPMDRLLCGDVGYGKTEVAMRAAMKAVMDSKQVAVLVPTTILAQQHYSTFVERFQGYPVRIEVLSRFKNEEEQNRIVREVKQGTVDIVIGTHRLLSKDVVFSDLGLLIIDEEHRFGVRHKEKIKQLKKEVDVLTLTATPIPRTLHMALSGLRDVSTIETPPEGRLPVQTYVVEYDDDLVRDAISRELSRHGQVYYVHNRVESIARCATKVKRLVPEARIAVAHGRTREEELSRIMEAFLAGEYDVLVTTMIIESGLDIPNVNTLIVEEADRLGLAQLYQIRGRVGRSNRVAYAYFTFSRGRVLTQQAESRLEAIREFTELGSGYRIAMRDLEIRGAGNILGPEQHGFLTAVGFGMYCRLLEESVKELKGEKPEERKGATLDIPLDAYLPVSYVPDETSRIRVYKKLASAASEQDLLDIQDELLDRFGEPPKPAATLLEATRIKTLASQCGVGTISLKSDRLILTVDDPSRFPVQAINAVSKTFRGMLSIASGESGNSIILKLENSRPDEALKTAGKLLFCLTHHNFHNEPA